MGSLLYVTWILHIMTNWNVFLSKSSRRYRGLQNLCRLGNGGWICLSQFPPSLIQKQNTLEKCSKRKHVHFKNYNKAFLAFICSFFCFFISSLVVTLVQVLYYQMLLFIWRDGFKEVTSYNHDGIFTYWKLYISF